MGSTSGYNRDRIGSFIVATDSEAVKDTLDGGSLANDIFVEKSDGEGVGIGVYCSCWDALLGTS